MNRETELFPVYSPEFLLENKIPGPMFNFYGWGGYLIWKLYPNYPVFIDGRANTVYPAQVYLDYMTISRVRTGWEKLLDSYGVNFIIYSKEPRPEGNIFNETLEKTRDWVLIYEDHVEKIFIRNNEKNKEIISRALSGKLRRPRTPYSLNAIATIHLKNSNFAQAEVFLNEALRISDRYIPAIANMAYIKLSQGKTDEAIKLYRQALSYNPIYAGLNYNLGAAYEAKGDRKNALKYYSLELEANPANFMARQKLNQLK